MDRPRERIAFIAAACVLLTAATAAPALLRAQAWTAPGENLASDLAHAPRECLTERSAAIEAGRALFRSPALLGGPAARLGLSCDSCHASGRVNARFFLPELTDRPGAADVTSEWASQVRGDGVMNPVDIPDLGGVSARAAFGQARDASLAHFVRGVIVDEFQGQPPPDQAFEALLAYLNALEACPIEPAPLTLGDAANDVRRALAAAEAADPPTAALLLLAAQDAIGRIAERLPQPAFAAERAQFDALARELGAMRGDVESARSTALPGWRARFDALIARLERKQRHTYFSQPRLVQALSGQ